MTRAVFHVLHCIAAAGQQDESIKDHLTILAQILKASNAALASSDFNTLKEIVFVDPSILNDLMMTTVPPLALEGEFKYSLNLFPILILYKAYNVSLPPWLIHLRKPIVSWFPVSVNTGSTC